jgi:hypothetical protein
MMAIWCIVSTPLFLSAAPVRRGTPEGETELRFEVTVAPGLLEAEEDGRILVVLALQQTPEPRRSLGQTGHDAAPVLARDVSKFAPGKLGLIDGNAAAFPIANLAHLPAGDYWVQALFDREGELRLPNAPGTLYSEPRRVHLDPAHGEAVRLELTREVLDIPSTETERNKFIKIHSELLSAFHVRPIHLRAGIKLPRDFQRDQERRYPLRVHIGGYGSRFYVFPPDDEAGDAMVHLILDGAGPLGDPSQVNSANHGPYGDALIRELIPYVEERFRCIGKPAARVLDGKSTGGWVCLALQIFYPDFFNGAWSSCPDPVDFRSFQLIDIYKDAHAYVNKYGFERPGARSVDGDVRETMRHQVQLESVLGRGDSWTLSGQQWGAWNAVFGPRGADGLPVPLWDAESGAIDREAAEHWKKYDLRLILEANWKDLGPKLKGKLHIWVGEADDYFLNNAVHQLDAFLSTADPPFEGTITYGPGQGHCWAGITEHEMLEQMMDAIRRGE